MSKRLIYAEDAIFALDALFVKQIKQFGYDSYEKADEKTQLVCDGISESIGCLLNMPSAQPVEDVRSMCGECDAWNIYNNYPQKYSQSQWIPCSERLPEEDTEVIVSCTDDSGDSEFSYATTGWHYKGIWVVDNERSFFVRAWMPLPEPWKDMRGEQDG